MSTRLDPLIHQKLKAFARRRRRLIIMRGVLAALAMLLMTMLIVAIVDFKFMLPEWGRWALSGMAYTVVIIVAWRRCLTWLLHAPDERQLARLIEHAEPRLREDLLSAVELGRTKGEVFDSEQFRELVQQDVAHRMEGVEVKSLLPVALIRRYIGYAFCVVAVLVAMGVATGWQFGTLILRALMPGANLDRVSQTKVFILEPNPAESVVPQGDTVRVVIELGGERASKASIETFGEKEGWQAMEMQPVGKDRFAATINVGRESVRYRIKAGDALTRKYLLDARERPFITDFGKTYEFPAYTKLAPKTVSEPDGALIAIEGTQVDLKLKPNQRVKVAELRLEQGKSSSTVPLAIADDGMLTARVPLNTSGSYRVHLVGAETGFENKFSPEYELRAEPDLVPSVDLDSPRNDLILPNNELVDIVGSASDDLGLAKVSKLVKVNDGRWTETILQSENLGQKAAVAHRWDLYELSAKPGDLITMKLVATDLKGNKGESRPLQITITAAGFELRRLQALESLRALNLATRALSKSAEEMSKTSQKSREQFNGADDGAARKQALVAWSGALTAFDAKFSEAWTSLGTALREAPAGHMSAELVMIGRELARLDVDAVRIAKANLDVLAANPGFDTAKKLANEAADLCSHANGRARITAEAMEVFTTAEETAVFAENAEVLAREQNRLMELAAASGDDAQKWQALLSRLRVALTQAKAVEDLLEPVSTRSGSRMKDNARRTAESFAKRRTKLEAALATGELRAKTLLEPTAEMTRVARDFARESADWHRGFGYEPVRMLQEIAKECGPTYANVRRLAQDVTNVKRGNHPADVQVAVLDSRWAVRADAFKAHGDIEELRTTADNRFVGDLRATTAAIEALRAAAAGMEQPVLEGKFADLDRSLRILESGHNLQEVLDGLNFLATNERWDLRSLAAKTQSPRDWRWLEGRMRMLPEEMGKAREADFDGEVKKAFEGAMQILWKAQQLDAWRGLNQEMETRGQHGRAPQSARADAEVLAGQVKLALDLLRKHMDEARKTLAKISPSISELAQALAKEQEDLKKETGEQAKETAKQVPEEAKKQNEQQLAQQQRLNEKVETLKDLIRAEANEKNILNAEERELMRDADDALAMLKDPPPAAERALQDAVNDAPPQQEADLQRAVEQQQKLEDALRQIARHFEAVEQGKPLAETREALRESEKELGVKEELDEQFAHAQMLAEMAQKDAAQLLAELEAKLPENPLMQKELSQISQDALAAAEQKLEQAAKAEESVAKQVAQQASPDLQKQTAKTAEQAAKQAVEAAQAAEQMAERAEKLGEAVGNQAVDQQADRAQDLAEEAKQAAEKALDAARQMANADNPKQAAKAAQKVMENAAEAAQAAQQSAEAAKQAQAAASEAAKQGGDQQPEMQESAQQSAQAAQQAEKAAQAARQAQQLAQQAAAQAEAMAQGKPMQNPQQNARENAKTAAEQAAQAAEKAAMAAQAAQKAAESAEAQAMAAENQAAAQQADAAGREAAEAAADAQAAAEAAGMAAESGSPQQAAKASQQAAQKAGEAAQAAEKAAMAAQQAQQSSQQAAQEGGDNQGENQQAAQQSGEAQQQAQAAAQAARQAQAAAQQAAQQAMAAAQQNQQLAQAAQQQQAIAQNAAEAAADLQRAGRHEMRLGNERAGQQIGQIGNEVQETAQSDVPAAQQALTQAQMAAEAQGAVNQAAAELAQELAALQNAAQGQPQQAGQQPPPGAQQAQAAQPSGQQPAAQGAQPSGQPASPAEQQAMARALDALDQQLNPGQAAQAGQQAGEQTAQSTQPGQPGEQSGQQPGQPGQPGQQMGEGQPSAAQAAMAQAAQAAQASMRQGRAQQGMAQQPGSLVASGQQEKSLGGATAQGGPLDYKLSTTAEGLKRGEWGKLPKKLAEQLTKGQQEAIAGDYRQAVEAYYRVIAEKAKEQK